MFLARASFRFLPLLLAAGRGRTGRALNLELAHNRVHFQINPNAAELAGIVHGGAQ